VSTQLEADAVNRDRQQQADMMTKHLYNLGVEVTSMNFTGDSSYPTEYYVGKQGLQGVGPTFDLALLDFIEKLLKRTTDTDEVTSYRAMETALQLLTGNILALRTELLVIKDVVTSEQ